MERKVEGLGKFAILLQDICQWSIAETPA